MLGALTCALLLSVVFGGYEPPSATAESVCPNEQLRRESGSLRLPDCRAYELVSPADKSGGDIMNNLDGEALDSYSEFVQRGFAQASLSGNAIEYTAQTAFAGAQSNVSNNEYLSLRAPGGWWTQGISYPQEPFSESSGFDTFSTQYQLSSADLSLALVRDVDYEDAPLAPGAAPHYQDLYLRNNGDGSLQALTKVRPPNRDPSSELGGNGFEACLTGATPDLRRIVYAANDALTSNAIEPSETQRFDLYEVADGQPRLVNVLPGNATSTDQAALGGIASSAEVCSVGGDAGHAISDDGSRVFWTDMNTGHLYVRENGSSTVEVSASHKTNGSGPGGIDPNTPPGGEQAVYWTAAADGAMVDFTSRQELTNDANTGSADHGNDLYQYDVDSGQLSDLTPDVNPLDANGANVQGVLGASGDLSYVYFVAQGALASGATSGQDNLYVRHNSVTSFIATLAGADIAAWQNPSFAHQSAVTPDGLHATFTSQDELTGFDNTDVVTGLPDSEVYLYSAQARTLICVSCAQSGARPAGPSLIPPWSYPTYQSHYLSEDGSRLFFDSADAVVPGAANARNNVYEYEQDGTGSCHGASGCVYLISSGTSEADSWFLDASPSGHDVFFTTRQQLVPADIDTNVDTYDARVAGGFPAPPAVIATVQRRRVQGTRERPSFAAVSRLGVVLGPGQRRANRVQGAGEAQPPRPPQLLGEGEEDQEREEAHAGTEALRAVRHQEDAQGQESAHRASPARVEDQRRSARCARPRRLRHPARELQFRGEELGRHARHAGRIAPVRVDDEHRVPQQDGRRR